MKAKRNRLMSTISLSAIFALSATAAIAADGDGLEKVSQARASVQQPAAPAAKAPVAQSVSDAARLQWIPTSDSLNVPGNAAFGRVASK